MGAIEVDGLTKRYGDAVAVEDVSFTVDPGQVVGLLGPNGAGKSTIMKILTGFHFPSQGTARIQGMDATEHSLDIRRLLGYLCESVPLYGEMTVGEYLRFICDIRNMESRARKERVPLTVGLCGLETVVGQRIGTLSLGFRQRVGLAQALVHDPPILILDEPTSGLDPNQIAEIRSLIRELGKRKAIILSTHILKEAEALCSRVIILNKGKIVAQGETEEIAAALGKKEMVWELELKGTTPEFLRTHASVLGTDVRISRLEETGEGTLSLVLRIKDPSDPTKSIDGERLFDWAVSGGAKIIRLRKDPPDLEDLFTRLTVGGGPA
jgi:ABC-2 type transport system ATP-binding protein